MNKEFDDVKLGDFLQLLEQLQEKGLPLRLLLAFLAGGYDDTTLEERISLYYRFDELMQKLEENIPLNPTSHITLVRTTREMMGWLIDHDVHNVGTLLALGDADFAEDPGLTAEQIAPVRREVKLRMLSAKK